MPIKFRCKHCRQLLGISRNRAGAIVDCPTCGRTIRVPRLDGHVDPIPEPELDLEDSELVHALDELAAIGTEPPSEDVVSRPAEGSAEPDVIETRPVPPPEPIEVAPATPAEPAAVEPPESVPPAEDVQPTPDVLASLAGAALATDTVATRRPEWLGRIVMVSIVAAVLALLAGFGVGLWVGLRLSGQPPVSSNPSPQQTSVEPQPVSTPDAGESSTESAQAPRSALTGRITYKTSSGVSRPDRGARVLVFPEKRRGGVKLPVVGFRPGDTAADFEIAVAGLRALGGNAAIVDEAGNYSLTLPAAGKYTVVVLSRYQARTEEEAVAPELAAILREYFEGAPERLVGQVRYHFGRVVYNGSEPITWDYSFEQQ